jgi:hypothetical protein
MWAAQPIKGACEQGKRPASLLADPDHPRASYQSDAS